jgi:hypothetical protein
MAGYQQPFPGVDLPLLAACCPSLPVNATCSQGARLPDCGVNATLTAAGPAATLRQNVTIDI